MLSFVSGKHGRSIEEEGAALFCTVTLAWQKPHVPGVASAQIW